MNYQRVLVLAELRADAGAPLDAVRRFAPSATLVAVIAEETARLPAWLRMEVDDPAHRALDGLRALAQRLAPGVEVVVTPEFTIDALADAAKAGSIDLVVVGELRTRSLAVVAQLRKRSSLPVLFARSVAEASAPGEGARLLCLGVSARERRAVGQFLRDHATATDRAVLLTTTRLAPMDLAELREVWGLAQALELSDGSGMPPRQLFGAPSRSGHDLVVMPRFPPVILLAVRPGPSVLVLPPLRPAPLEWERAIDAPDFVDDGTGIRARIEYAAGVGRRIPIADQPVAFVREGKVVARADSRRGEVELSSGLGNSLGIFRVKRNEAEEAVVFVEAQVGVLRPGPRPIFLFDAEIAKDYLPLLRGVAWADAVGVRMRPLRSCGSLRADLRAAGLAPCVIDASAVLDEGEASDVPEWGDGVRLARVATRMRLNGFTIAAVVYRSLHPPSALGFAAIRPEDLETLSAEPAPPARRPLSLGERLAAITGHEPIAGNRVDVEMDNRTARRWLLSAIEASRRRVHLQVYMAADDDVGRSVEAALAAAAARGVAVRVLVDSLHGLHGSLGTCNPLLARLASRPGIDLRVSKPISGVPSLEDLKQRDHRKLAVIDGEAALLGGRNLSHEYYTGFDEVHLTANVPWRAVPWLEAGARVRGPAVAQLERLFLQAWTEAGGEPFDVPAPAQAGDTSARVIAHRGLRDAFTLEAYLALLDSARSHVYVVNGFPLVLEIQHALLRALRRGVRVRTLFGNLTPTHGEVAFTGPWAHARTAATSFVHSRMDPLVAAGGECYEFVVPHLACWDPALGDLRPHVHAKALSVDARVCSVGSANFDVTAAYWESELVLVIEDAAIARRIEARFDELLGGSHRVDPQDPGWRRRAEQRRWMRYWPGTLSI